MGQQEAINRWKIEEYAMEAYTERHFFKMDGQFLTPHEFLTLTKDKWIFPHSFTIIDPKNMIDKGRLKLYELMNKQMLFEKKFHEYYDNPPELQDMFEI